MEVGTIKRLHNSRGKDFIVKVESLFEDEGIQYAEVSEINLNTFHREVKVSDLMDLRVQDLGKNLRYTQEARESTMREIGKLVKVLKDVPDNVISFTDNQRITLFLAEFKAMVQEEYEKNKEV